MPQSCSICIHPERSGIDAALVSREPLRAIAQRYAVSRDALHRHKRDHIPVHLAQASEAADVAASDDLLGQMVELQAKTLRVLGALEQSGDHKLWLTGLREARGNIELLAKLTHQLSDGPTVNILVATEWLTVRAALLEALQPYPEARAAVSGRLAALEAGHAGN